MTTEMVKQYGAYTMDFGLCNDGIQWFVRVKEMGWSSSGYDAQAEAEVRAAEVIDGWEQFKRERVA